MRLDSIDTTVIRVLSEKREVMSAWSIAKYMSKHIGQKFNPFNITHHCQKLVKFKILEQVDGAKGVYYKINENRAFCEDGMTVVNVNSIPIIIDCPFFDVCKEKKLSEECKLFKSSKKIRKLFK